MVTRRYEFYKYVGPFDDFAEGTGIRFLGIARHEIAAGEIEDRSERIARRARRRRGPFRIEQRAQPQSAAKGEPQYAQPPRK